MTKLNQLLAVEMGVRDASQQSMAAAGRTFQRDDLFHGLTRAYRPKDDDGDRMPPEHKQVQERVDDVLNSFGPDLARLIDVTLEKDTANTVAKADVKLDGTVILSEVPVPTLLFLEKKLTALRSIINTIPTLDRSERWEMDHGTATWVTAAVETHKTRKVPKSHVLYEATDKHPAQVHSYTEDEVIGYWSTTKLSTAMSDGTKQALQGRVDNLLDAVKQAREEANSVEVMGRSGEGADLLNYLLYPAGVTV